MPSYTIPPIIVHTRLAAAPAEIRPWSIDPLGIRKLGPNRGRGVRWGVVDTGVDATHATSGDLSHSVKDARDFTSSSRGEWDVFGHGTHVASIIAGVERANGGPGVAPACEIYSAKGLGDDGSGDDRSIAESILWCRFEKKCHGINLSLGGPQPSPTILKAAYQVIDDGGIVVCAAGNEGDFATSWPANDERMISVAATDQQERPADFSSPSSVDVAAPGVKILACYRNGGYSVLSGTSMAAPWFSGWLAILFGDLIAAGKPLPKQDQVFDLIDDWTKDIGAPGRDKKTGGGLVSPDKYKRQVTPVTPPAKSWWNRLRFNKKTTEGETIVVGVV